jgi:glycosyltransferase involved in cell wall biosynthesis
LKKKAESLEPYISVSIPAYNEAENLERVVGAIVRHLEGKNLSFEVIVVNDGSQDGTGEVADTLTSGDTRVKAIHHPVNRGYGGALRSGFSAAGGEVVCLYPGDGQFDFREVDQLLEKIDEADIVAGYRMKRKDPFYRKVNEVLYNLLIRAVFGIKVKDVDCGFKLYRREVLQSIPLESEGALIDAELLAKAGKKGFTITQVGVNHYPRLHGEQTGANIGVIMRMFLELYRLYSRINR